MEIFKKIKPEWIEQEEEALKSGEIDFDVLGQIAKYFGIEKKDITFAGSEEYYDGPDGPYLEAYHVFIESLVSHEVKEKDLMEVLDLGYQSIHSYVFKDGREIIGISDWGYTGYYSK